MVGDASVGKSTLLQFYINRQFNDSNNPTMGVEFATKKLKVKDKVVKLQIWDTVSFLLSKGRTGIIQDNYKGILQKRNRHHSHVRP